MTQNLVKEKKLVLITPAQSWLLSYFDEPFEWCIYSKFFLLSNLSQKKLINTYKILIQRHDALRATFINHNNIWQQQVIHYNELPNILPLFYTAENLPEDEKSRLEEDVLSYVYNTFNISKFPLFRIIVIKISPSRHKIIFALHHIIADYISCLVIFKEFYEIYQALVNGTNLDNKPVIRQSSDYSKQIEFLTKKCQIEAMAFFWKEHLLQALSCYTLAPSILTNPSPEENSVKLDFLIPKNESQKLLRHAKYYYKCKSLHYILATPLYKSLAELLHCNTITISHKLHGRSFSDGDLSFFNTIGNFAINAPIVLEINDDDNYSNIIYQLREKFNTMPMQGLSYDLVAQYLPSQLYPDHKLTSIRFNYLGNICLPCAQNINIDYNEFAQRRSNPLQPLTTYIEIYPYIVQQEIHIGINFDSLAFEMKTIEKLIDLYIFHLKSLISSLS